MFIKYVILVLCAVGSFAKFPSDIPQCKAEDLECIVRVSNEVVRKYPQGRPDLGLPAYDPYVLRNFYVNQHQSPDAPINLNIFLKEGLIYGLSQTIFQKAVGWGSNPNKTTHELYGVIPKLQFKGKYKADGKVLFLSIQGDGDFDITLHNVTSGIKFKSYVVEENGHLYAHLKKVKCLFEPSKVSGHLTNFGNKELETAINYVLNNNWRDGWDELSPGVLRIAENIIKNTLQKFFDIHEFDDFYLQ